MAKRDVIYWLRNVKHQLAASGVVGRQFIPFVEVGEFWLSHGFREVVIRSRRRLGLPPPARTAAAAPPRLIPETVMQKPVVAEAGEQAVDDPRRAAYKRTYLRALATARNRVGPEFVPEAPANPRALPAQVRALAFYLPQFHPIPENDAWWGKGFTEWTNVSTAVPQFEGHYQPHLPGELGFYDLRVPAVQRRQVELARQYGIHGFCFHYYWFNGRRLLERPLDQFVADTSIDFPFCICWANESWTRRWDGDEHDVLMRQVHTEDTDLRFIHDLEPLLRHPRYITINGRPLIVVYRVLLMPNGRATAERWRAHCRSVGLPDPYLVAAQTFTFTDPRSVGFDAAVEFPPHNIAPPDVTGSLTFLNPAFEGKVAQYNDLSVIMQAYNASSPFKVFKCVSPGWDNDARKPGRGYTFTGSTPALYKEWLSAACAFAVEDPEPEARIVFINAWNEWAEGAHLEPDRRYGYAYLEATRDVVHERRSDRPRVSAIVPNYNHARFLERRLESILTQARRPDEVIFLDDASTDDSVAIARRLLGRSGIAHRIIVNDLNTGNVFAQWLKGIQEADGDLLWIAESDDDADPGFLSAILPQFAREDVLIAYGRIAYIKPDGSPNDDLTGYYDHLSGDHWQASHARTARDLFAGDFAVKNLIPNASGAVFRRPVLTDDEKARLMSYKFAGDWYFYALVSRGGSISYCKEAKSYFRKVPTSTSRAAFFTERHVADHGRLLDDLRALHGIADDFVERHRQELKRILALQPGLAGAPSPAAVDALRPAAPVSARGLRVCVASYGFGIGGGELAPIMLSNALRGLGHHVTLLVMNPETPGDASFRCRLRPDIPVLSWPDCVSRFDRVALDFGWDVINSHNVAIEYAFFLRGIAPSARYVATLHGGYETVPEIMTEPFVAYLERTVDAWVFTAEKNKRTLLEHGLTGARFVKGFNAVSVLWGVGQADIRRRLQMTPDSVALVLASRAIHDKGWDIAMDATVQVREATGRDVRLLLVGDGEHAPAMRDRAKDRPFVHFWGATGDVAAILRECDLAVFPTTYIGESFPLFLLECFAAGLPAVATDVGSIREMLTTGAGAVAGALIAMDDDRARMARDMGAALTALLTRPGGLAEARAHAAERSRFYDTNRMAAFYLEVFRSLPPAGR